VINSDTKVEVTREGEEAIKKKAKNGKPNGLWMEVKWGGVFWISELKEREKYKEDEGNKGINRIGFYWPVTYLDIGCVKDQCITSHSKCTISHEEVER